MLAWKGRIIYIYLKKHSMGSYLRTIFSNQPSRDVAQSGRAPRSGRGGRWFKSSRPDQKINTRESSIHKASAKAPKILIIRSIDL